MACPASYTRLTIDLPCLLERLVSEGLSRHVAPASEAKSKSPPTVPSPGGSASTSASVGSSWGSFSSSYGPSSFGLWPLWRLRRVLRRRSVLNSQS